MLLSRHTRRRAFIGLLGGAAAWPLVARAQQAATMPMVGFLGTPSAAIWAPRTAAFVRRLDELGWTEGRTIALRYRWAEGRSERFGPLAAELVSLGVDVIVTSGAAVDAVKRVTTTIPVVFAIGADPVGSGHVASLARPGGNITGLSLQAPDVAGKRLEFLSAMKPGLRRLAILANVGYPASLAEIGEVEAAARPLGYDSVRLEIRRAEDIEPAFGSAKGRADALYVCGFDPLVNGNRGRINALAVGMGLPAVYGEQNYVQAGGLMSYGPNFPDLFRRSAGFVDKILRGAKPADLPVEQPTKFDLAINLKTAKALGLDVPDRLLALADEVIE
jgi:putative ABC transport system substrate-binding protein